MRTFDSGRNINTNRSRVTFHVPAPHTRPFYARYIRWLPSVTKRLSRPPPNRLQPELALCTKTRLVHVWKSLCYTYRSEPCRLCSPLRRAHHVCVQKLTASSRSFLLNTWWVPSPIHCRVMCRFPFPSEKELEEQKGELAAFQKPCWWTSKRLKMSTNKKETQDDIFLSITFVHTFDIQLSHFPIQKYLNMHTTRQRRYWYTLSNGHETGNSLTRTLKTLGLFCSL